MEAAGMFLFIAGFAFVLAGWQWLNERIEDWLDARRRCAEHVPAWIRLQKEGHERFGWPAHDRHLEEKTKGQAP